MFEGGLVALLIAVGLGVGHYFTRRKAGRIAAASPKTVSQLHSLNETLSAELGPNALNESVTLRGMPEVDEPLEAPLSGRKCLHYAVRVERKYEETYEDKDDEGHVQTRTRRGSETMSQQDDSTSFEFSEGGKSVHIELSGADHDSLTESFDQFEPQGQNRWASVLGISIGGYSSHHGRGRYGGRVTLGYRYQEHLLEADRELTVVGQVQARDGVLQVGKSDGIFLVSQKTRQQLLGRAQMMAKGTLVGSGLSLVTALVLMVLGVVDGAAN